MKNLFVTALCLVVLTGCGKRCKTGPQGAPGAQGMAGEKGDKGDTGERGEDGTDAAISAYQVSAIIDPCGDAPGIVDEVLLKLHNGQILVSFSDNASGLNTRFAVLGAGSYRTTDGTNCNFSVDGSGNVSF